MASIVEQRSLTTEAFFARLRLALAALVLAGCWAPAGGADFEPGALVVKEPWVRETIGGSSVTAAYLTIVNDGRAPDRLVGVASPAAGHAELHTHLMEGGMMKMREIKEVPVAAQDDTVFEPGGKHIMLFDVSSPLRQGDRVLLRLTFEKSGTLEVQAEVRGLAP